jgi:hypothetical protein
VYLYDWTDLSSWFATLVHSLLLGKFREAYNEYNVLLHICTTSLIRVSIPVPANQAAEVCM